jgi:formylglycine-generating enzyme required for sulfatase activity
MRHARSHARGNLVLLMLSGFLSLALVVPVPPRAKAQQQGNTRQLTQEETEKLSGGRVALVIGNGAYTNAPRLKNPVNDATDIAEALSKLGFTVDHGVDLNQKQMKFMIREFGKKLKAGGQGLFYFSGHGVQLNGRNYLIPVDAEITSEADVEDQGVDAEFVLNLMRDAKNGLNVVILDACRNNPFARSLRSASGGLAQVDAPTGTLIAYATAPGRVAQDGVGRNGTYTAELLRQMRVPGVPVEEMFKRVRANVLQQTSEEQVPWEASSLVGDFYFNAAGSRASSTANKQPSGATGTEANAAAFELEYWNAIKDSNDPEEYQGYLKRYPNGQFAEIARRRAAGTRGGNNTGAQPIKPPTNAATNTTNTVASRPKPGAVVRNQMGMELVYVSAGSFMMGSNFGNNEMPVHQVTIQEGFYMGRYEVTQAQWQAVMGNNPSRFKGDNLPVEQVSWDDAQEFIRRLNARGDGYTYRLPSEAEWEYACRAGTTGDYAGNLDAMAWYDKNSGPQTHPVGQKQPNGFGLYDMHGNVWEWCEDWYHDGYNGAPTDGSAWLSGGYPNLRMLRGGSFGGYAFGPRSALRIWYAPGYRGVNGFGFRLVAVART